MNKKAFELAISTLILIILGVLVLIGVIIAVTGGFDRFKETTSPFTDTATAQAITQSCKNACQQDSKYLYCCPNYKIDNKPINCTDTRLELGCTLNCTNFNCGE